jgi:hypothetical protein
MEVLLVGVEYVDHQMALSMDGARFAKSKETGLQ